MHELEFARSCTFMYLYAYDIRMEETTSLKEVPCSFQFNW
jgi:hypothetical protein